MTKTNDTKKASITIHGDNDWIGKFIAIDSELKLWAKGGKHFASIVNTKTTIQGSSVSTTVFAELGDQKCKFQLNSHAEFDRFEALLLDAPEDSSFDAFPNDGDDFDPNEDS